MNQRRVRFTATAQRQIQRERTWWIDNRVHVDVFVKELDDAIRVLQVLPGAGSSYPQAGIPGLRRLYLRKLACHLLLHLRRTRGYGSRALGCTPS